MPSSDEWMCRCGHKTRLAHWEVVPAMTLDEWIEFEQHLAAMWPVTEETP